MTTNIFDLQKLKDNIEAERAAAEEVEHSRQDIAPLEVTQALKAARTRYAQALEDRIKFLKQVINEEHEAAERE